MKQLKKIKNSKIPVYKRSSVENRKTDSKKERGILTNLSVQLCKGIVQQLNG